DQVDVNISVVEKPTGTMLLGAGYGSGEGLLISGSISQNNIFGSGKHLSLQANSSKLNTNYSISFTDPYFTVDGVSLGGDIYLRKLSADANILGRYETETYGAQFRLGVPVTERDTISYGLGVENTKITTFPDSPLLYRDYVNTFGEENTNFFFLV